MLIGNKISLRPTKIDDWQHFYKWLNDPEVTNFIGFHLPLSEMQEKRWIDEQVCKQNSTEVLFVIEHNDQSKSIGFCCINKINYKDRNAELTIIIGESSFWGQNLGTEIGNLLINYAFGQLNLNRLYTGVYNFNKRSLKSIVKLGFKKEGRQRQAVFKNGSYHDIILFGLLHNEKKN